MKFKNNHKQTNTGRTHWKKGHIPWNKGLKGTCIKKKTGWEITCIVCGKKKYYQLNEHKKRTRKYCSLKCYREGSRKDKLTYSGIHSRIVRDYGKAKKCFVCKTTKNVDWANISNKYLIDKSDWIELCRKHHIAYDRGNLILKR